MTETRGFGSLQIAAAMRDAIIQIAQKEIDSLRPEMKVAVVKEINTSQLSAKVQLAGDTGTFNARFGASLMPRQAGDLVRISGKVGNYYITEILNNTGAHAIYDPVIDLITDPDGNVDVTPGIPPGAVEQVHLGDASVGSDQIQILAVSEEKIADGAVTVNKLNVVMGGGQMMDNSSFENVTDFMNGWTVSGSAPTRETAIVHGLGLAAARFSATTVGYREVSNLEIGKVYTVTAYGWLSSGATIVPTMRVSDGSGGNSQDQTITVSGTWVRSVARYTANVTGKVRVALMGSGTGAGTGYVVWDDVQVERGDIATAWNPKVTELLPGVIKGAMLEAGSVVIGGSDAVVFAPGYDPSTKATQTDLTNVAEVGRLQDNYLPNSTFDDWPVANAAPTGYMLNAGTPVRETTVLRTQPTALRFNLGAGVAGYIQPTQYPIGNTPFVTVRTDVQLISGTWGGSGILVRWYNTTGGTYDATVDFNTLLAGMGTGLWWRVETVVPRPSGFSGTFLRLEVWPIGGWTGIGTISAKNIVFDQLSARPSTTDEIKAWTAGLWAYPGTTKINGGLLQTGTVIADYVQANAINALTEIVGPAIKTQSSGRRIVMRNDGSGGVIEGFSGNPYEITPAKISPGFNGSGSSSRGYLMLESPQAYSGYYSWINLVGMDAGGANPSYIQIQTQGPGSSISMYAGSNIILSAPSTTATGNLSASGDFTVGGYSDIQGMVARGLANFQQGVTIYNGLNVQSGSIQFNGVTISSVGHIRGSGNAQMNDGFYDMSLVGGGTTGASIGNGGKIIRTAPSSIKYKHDFRSFRPDLEALKKLKTWLFRYKDKEIFGDQLFAGVIAEQARDLGLTEFLTYNSDGSLRGFNYEYLLIALLYAWQQD